jgi:hypothetical protein
VRSSLGYAARGLLMRRKDGTFAVFHRAIILPQLAQAALSLSGERTRETVTSYSAPQC